MKYYQEITLLPTPEISQYFLWQKIYQPLHMLMVETKSKPKDRWVSVSFPKYSKKALGDKLRVFALSEQALEEFALKKTLRKFEDYVHITGIRPVPASIEAKTLFKRVQPKQNNLSYARRYAKYRQMDIEEAFAQLNQKPSKSLPFINLKSLSTKQNLRLILRQEKVPLDEDRELIFNAYGLNNPVPDF
ncbi:type I-F CRISPR-associated endoribonuclease Cas6/Csy4 [Thiomicrorhabdus xiamenensis]|uniref:Type I-F CRISPR-associated endoribonuclease Cas6/Csy4 n=1 Tax=Thiomicrorhabdus xiamenensis TaxID=2739063 RepID=A0A7D4NPQ7_9GAMM|nr:type I-F CRISPR-associated endoribonuclease Cas6/Csy4 [Thiomicrorhabdus xiamenensis]QKI88152.1 type I-F CRISPR-associated endoribonuclease Cas6/Csy4 [Thiomicrorhabdus xiamenensis]